MTCARPIRHRLVEISIELTSKCNLSCAMCSVWKGRRDGIPGDRVRALLAEARRLGADTFTPSGAEIFMRRDTVDLLAEAGRLGFRKIPVVTNGMLVPRHIDALAAIPGLEIHVSIDGPEPVHDSLRGAGSFAAAMAGVDAAVAAGRPVSLKCVLMRPTLPTAAALVGIAKAHGVGTLSFQPFQPEIAGAGEDHGPWVFPAEARAEVAEAVRALLDAARLAGIAVSTEEIFRHLVPYLFDGRRPVPPGGCFLPSRFVLIDGRGETYPCFFMRGQSMGNVMRGVGLRDIWAGPVQTEMARRGREGRCPGCLASCSDVPAFGQRAEPVSHSRDPVPSPP